MLIKNVKIITPNKVLIGYSLLIKNGIIVDIDLENKFNDEYYKVIDGSGNFLSPGFIDIHNHGNSGFDIMDSTENALNEIGKYHFSNGVTSYLGTIITSSCENIVKAMDNIYNYSNKSDSAKILGIHLEGPFFNVLKKGAQPEKHILQPDIFLMESLINPYLDKIKMVSLAPELNGALEVIEYLRKKDIVVALGHTNATLEEGNLAISCGATIATHLYNGMRSFDHREPGIIGSVLNDSRIFAELIYDRIHIHDDAVKIALKMKGYDKIILISDSIRATGLGDGKYELGGQNVYVTQGVARLKTGNLAGSTLNLRKAVYNMVNYLDVPIFEAVKMASLNPATAINTHHNIGSIELGKKANLIIFDNDINIKNVIIDNNIYSV